MESLERRVAKMIINRCKLNDIDIETCDFEAPLFLGDDDISETGFELDSVDALELVAGVKEEFGIMLNVSDMNVFYSVATLTKYIEEHTKAAAQC